MLKGLCKTHFGVAALFFFRCPSDEKISVCAEFLPAGPPKGPRSPLNSRCDALAEFGAAQRLRLFNRAGLSRRPEAGPAVIVPGRQSGPVIPAVPQGASTCGLRLLLSPSDIFAYPFRPNVSCRAIDRVSLVWDLPSRGHNWDLC